MGLTPEQYSQIAKTYDSAAADHMMPPHQRTAFARKAEWYRMLARLGAKPKKLATDPKAPPPHFAREDDADPRPTPMISAVRNLFAWQQRR